MLHQSQLIIFENCEKNCPQHLFLPLKKALFFLKWFKATKNKL